MKTKGKGLSQLWKRNAVVAAIALFVCAAVYLNWSYEQEAAGKTLGESTLVGKEDPLLGGTSGSSSGGTEDESQTEGEAQSEAEASQTGETSGDYFSTARLNRQQSRDSALALLQDAAGEDADQTLKDEANETIQAMADYTVTEAQIENLVIAKGYADCVAFIGENALSLAVAAPEGGLTDTDTARIVDVVHQTTGFTADQVKIIAVEPQA
ncbi:MAG: SpoIIIAH-like family protein [Oscillospiraceae bacterium]|nr:SpoIIIAH-like family protein [Oscillospiraceae bacterium]